MQKYIMLTLFLIASAMAIVFSITSVNQTDEFAEEPLQENELRFVAENFKFDQETYTVPAGEPILVTMQNKPGGGIHGVAIEGTDINLQDGDQVEFTFEPGTYNVVCSVMCGTGHAEMHSKLIVEAPGEGEGDQQGDGAEGGTETGESAEEEQAA